VSSGGGCFTQSPQRVTPTGTGRAQPPQRAAGGAKRATQASHTGSEGQARQTAHRLGRRESRAVKGRESDGGGRNGKGDEDDEDEESDKKR
jgi:hypothetical protein